MPSDDPNDEPACNCLSGAEPSRADAALQKQRDECNADEERADEGAADEERADEGAADEERAGFEAEPGAEQLGLGFHDDWIRD